MYIETGETMTEYTEKVEAVRLQQQLDEFSKGVKYIHANNGCIETKYNNGDILYEYTRGPKEGKKEWYRARATRQSLLDKMMRVAADMRHK